MFLSCGKRGYWRRFMREMESENEEILKFRRKDCWKVREVKE